MLKRAAKSSRRQLRRSKRAFSRRTVQPALTRVGLAVESLERRVLLAADMGGDEFHPGGSALSDSTGMTDTMPEPFLVDIAATGGVNSIQLSVVAGQLELRNADTDELIAAADLEMVSEIIVTGSADPDHLILDFAGGQFDRPIEFDGLGPSSGEGDRLTVTGATVDSVVHHFENASDGRIDFSVGSVDQPIVYRGLEPIIDNLLATDRVFTFTGGTETIILADDPSANDNINRIDSTLGELVDFVNPTHSLTINAGTGMDVVRLEELDALTITTDITVNGQLGDDQIEVRSLPAAVGLRLVGGLGTDTFLIGSVTSSLDDILGDVSVNGSANPAGTLQSDSVSIGGSVIAPVVLTGDTLLIEDSGSAGGHQYSLAANSVQRVGGPSITLNQLEEVQLNTSLGSADVEINGTPDTAVVSVLTQGSDDAVVVTGTGTDSILRVVTGTGNDTVTISDTGVGSVLDVSTQAGEDDVVLNGAGDASGSAIDMGADIDVLTISNTSLNGLAVASLLGGDDIVNIRGASSGSTTSIQGGGDNDTFNISSDADGNRVDARGPQAGDLDAVLGQLIVSGNGNGVATHPATTVTAGGVSVTATPDSGDELNIADRASASNNIYTLTESEFTKTGQPAISYATIETLNIETGLGQDEVLVTDTRPSTLTTLLTHGDVDSVFVDDTGSDSVLLIDTGVSDDTATINSTGGLSVVLVTTLAGDDDVIVNGSGNGSGIDVETGSGVDVVLVAETGANSVTSIALGSGNDIANVQRTGLNSWTAIGGGAGDDSVNVSSGADGSRGSVAGTQSGSMDGLLGGLVLDGNGEVVGSLGSEAVSVAGALVTRTIASGDQLWVADQSTAATNSYSLISSSLVPTGSAIQRLGGPTINYHAFELVDLETGASQDTFVIDDTLPLARTRIFTNGGDDQITVQSQRGNVLRVDTGVGNDSVQVDGTATNEFLFLHTRAGDDDVTINDTGDTGALYLETGSGRDLLAMNNTGLDTINRISLGGEDDVANVRGSGLGSRSRVQGDAGNDTINVSSNASGDRVDETGIQTGTLNNLRGLLVVDGSGHSSGIPIEETIVAGALSAAVSIDSGDVLNLIDQGSSGANAYTLAAGYFDKTGQASIRYNAIESLNVLTGIGDDQVLVRGTAAEKFTSLETFGGDDVVTINQTGIESLFRIDTGLGDDTLDIRTTGLASVVTADTRAGQDDAMMASSGDASGVAIEMGSDADLLTINSTGAGSVATVSLSGDDDIANLQGSGAGSISHIELGAQNDVVNVSGQADGTRANPDGSQSGSLSGIGGVLNIDGGDALPSSSYTESVTAVGQTVSVSTLMSDRINFTDLSLAASSQYILSATQLERIGIPVIEFSDFESLDLITSQQADILQILSTRAGTRTEISTQGGDDEITVANTGALSTLRIDSGINDDNIVIQDTGSSSVSVIDTLSGDDDVTVAGTGIQSGVNIKTGSQTDVLTVVSTGILSVTAVYLGGGGDVANVRGTAVDSVLGLSTGSGDDMVNVNSVADGNRTDLIGRIDGTLDNVLGELIVYGNGQTATTPSAGSVSANGESVFVLVDGGDRLNVSDSTNATDHTYTVNESKIMRVSSLDITYLNIEWVEMFTGQGADTITVSDTVDATRFNLTTNAGGDVVTIDQVGDDVLFDLETGLGDDRITVNQTGMRSVVRMETNDGEDVLQVLRTADSSGLELIAGDGGDLVTIDTTGASSVTELSLGGGEDVTNIRGMGLDSQLFLAAGVESDFVNISSAADGTLAAPNTIGLGNLDGVLGNLVLDASVGQVAPLVSLTTQARRTDGSFVSKTTEVKTGALLSINDTASVSDHSYSLTESEFQRTSSPATGLITFSKFEVIDLRTGSGSDQLAISSTGEGTLVDIETGNGNDQVQIDSTGQESLLRVSSGLGDDVVSLFGNGDDSSVLIQTAAGEDEINIHSISDGGAYEVTSGSDSDRIHLHTESSPVSPTTMNVLSVDAGAGDDTFVVEEVFLGTIIDLQGNAGVDTFELSADASTPDGYLSRLNSDPFLSPPSDSLAASRELFIDGGGHAGSALATVNQGVTLSSGDTPQPLLQTVSGIALGDIVIVDASAATDALDLRYVMTDFGKGVFATTSPSDPRASVGNEVFESIGIERVQLSGGSDNDLLTISSLLPYDVSQTGQLVSFDGDAGTDKIEFAGTASADQITVGPIGSSPEPFEIDGVEFIRIEGDEGDDQLVNQTNVTSVIDALGGSDIVLGGSAADLITGGDGVDFLFGRAGNDALFTDQDLGSNTPTVLPGEIIDGGTEDTLDPGDLCLQFDADFARSCELIGNGGAQHDVLTWLRGIFVDTSDIQFDPDSGFLTPFLLAMPEPVAVQSVSEPSQVPIAPSADPISAGSSSKNAKSSSATGEGEPAFSLIDRLMHSYDPQDTNRDGRITPADALLVINRLARLSILSQPKSSALIQILGEVADVNRNGQVEPRDALEVINRIAAAGSKPTADSNETAEPWHLTVDQFFDKLRQNEGSTDQEDWEQEIESRLF